MTATARKQKAEKKFSREQVKWARDKELLIYRTLREERNRVQVDSLQRQHFGQWSDIFSSLEKCSGRVMVCLLGKTVIGYQAFTPFAEKGNPFPEHHQVMRLTFVQVREDEVVKARGLGVGYELVKRVENLAWDRGYDAIYSYVTAYELLMACGFEPTAGQVMVKEAQWIRDLDADQAPPLLFTKTRPDYWGYVHSEEY
jgi:predicted N-acetyltransferase YhbS